MCFKNLPIEFDEDGNATLVLYPNADEHAKPRKPIEDNPEAIKALIVRNGWLTEEQADLAAAEARA